ncbi:MAG: hypothetical protein K5838_03825 [Elusimicrobiales bacterium]|nr:hypothetical protein [Elusimicrobiales bacterium]
MKKTFALIAALAVVPAIAFAADKVDEKQFTIDVNSIELVELSPIPNDNYNRLFRRGEGGPTGNSQGATIPAPSELPQAPSGPSVPTIPSVPTVPSVPTLPMAQDSSQAGFQQGVQNASAVVALIDQIVNLVDKIFTIIAKGQPVVNINVNYANAVPYGISHWTQLQGWKAPMTKRYGFYCKNLYGMKVVDVEYQVHYTYGGNYNGVGKYLTGVTVEPLKVDTAWGYNVDMVAEVPDSTITNVGTAENPIAAMQVQLRYKIHTIIKDSQEKEIFYVRGDGQFKRLTASRGIGSSDISVKTAPSKSLQKKIQNVKF